MSTNQSFSQSRARQADRDLVNQLGGWLWDRATPGVGSIRTISTQNVVDFLQGIARDNGRNLSNKEGSRVFRLLMNAKIMEVKNQGAAFLITCLRDPRVDSTGHKKKRTSPPEGKGKTPSSNDGDGAAETLISADKLFRYAFSACGSEDAIGRYLKSYKTDTDPEVYFGRFQGQGVGAAFTKMVEATWLRWRSLVRGSSRLYFHTTIEAVRQAKGGEPLLSEEPVHKGDEIMSESTETPDDVKATAADAKAAEERNSVETTSKKPSLGSSLPRLVAMRLLPEERRLWGYLRDHTPSQTGAWSTAKAPLVKIVSLQQALSWSYDALLRMLVRFIADGLLWVDREEDGLRVAHRPQDVIIEPLQDVQGLRRFVVAGPVRQQQVAALRKVFASLRDQDGCVLADKLYEETGKLVEIRETSVGNYFLHCRQDPSTAFGLLVSDRETFNLLHMAAQHLSGCDMEPLAGTGQRGTGYTDGGSEHQARTRAYELRLLVSLNLPEHWLTETIKSPAVDEAKPAETVSAPKQAAAPVPPAPTVAAAVVSTPSAGAESVPSDADDELDREIALLQSQDDRRGQRLIEIEQEVARFQQRLQELAQEAEQLAQPDQEQQARLQELLSYRTQLSEKQRLLLEMERSIQELKQAVRQRLTRSS